MKLLLDTHILVWCIGDPGRLKPGLTDLLEAGETEIWVSPVSAWECLALAQKGRLQLAPEPGQWFRRALRSLAAREPVINHEVGLVHGDPADRLLAASALTLVTADDRLLQGTFYSVPANQ